MESFFRYISYADYYKNEERIKNVGFLRWKLYNGEHQIELQLKNINCSQGKYEIKEKNTGKIIGEIIIDKGIGNFVKTFPSISASGEMYIESFDGRLYLEEIEGFSILLNPNEYLFIPVKFEKKKKERVVRADFKYCNLKEKNQSLGNTSEDTHILNHTKEVLEKSELEDKQDAKAAAENVLIEGFEEKYADQIVIKDKEYENKFSYEGKNQLQKIIEPIYEDKWQQLCKKYPNVHPFPNGKIFLSIKPQDFIILQQEYQKLVQNSFLLHGFYNYGHMILGKLSEEEEASVYIGIPGVYYEQEKRAAQMFGFVGFESTEHPVRAGSYGYYMIEVKI